MPESAENSETGGGRTRGAPLVGWLLLIDAAALAAGAYLASVGAWGIRRTYLERRTRLEISERHLDVVDFFERVYADPVRRFFDELRTSPILYRYASAPAADVQVLPRIEWVHVLRHRLHKHPVFAAVAFLPQNPAVSPVVVRRAGAARSSSNPVSDEVLLGIARRLGEDLRGRSLGQIACGDVQAGGKIAFLPVATAAIDPDVGTYGDVILTLLDLFSLAAFVDRIRILNAPAAALTDDGEKCGRGYRQSRKWGPLRRTRFRRAALYVWGEDAACRWSYRFVYRNPASVEIAVGWPGTSEPRFSPWGESPVWSHSC